MEQLEAFIDESIEVCRAHHYLPTAFMQMRQRRGTEETIRLLVTNGEIQSGFRRMRELGLLDWTLEASVIKFPKLFNREVVAAAQFRLQQVGWAGFHP